MRPDRVAAATLVFEGSRAEVIKQKLEVYSIAGRFGGVSGGSDNGRRGYAMTYMIGG